MQCEVEGCNRIANTKKYGNVCLMHYKRFDRTQSFKLYEKKSNGQQKCEFCDRQIWEKGGGARGMCNKHYQNWLRHNDPLYTDKKRAENGSRGYRKRIGGKAFHRIVYEEHIGREIRKGEVIHHINCDKIDNRIQNLHLCKSQSEHSILHKKLDKLAGELVKYDIILFREGDYEINFEKIKNI